MTLVANTKMCWMNYRKGPQVVIKEYLFSLVLQRVLVSLVLVFMVKVWLVSFPPAVCVVVEFESGRWLLVFSVAAFLFQSDAAERNVIRGCVRGAAQAWTFSCSVCCCCCCFYWKPLFLLSTLTEHVRRLGWNALVPGKKCLLPKQSYPG